MGVYHQEYLMFTNQWTSYVGTLGPINKKEKHMCQWNHAHFTILSSSGFDHYDCVRD